MKIRTMNRSDFFIDDRVNVSFIPPIYSSLAGIDLVTFQLLFYETFWLVKRIGI